MSLEVELARKNQFYSDAIENFKQGNLIGQVGFLNDIVTPTLVVSSIHNNEFELKSYSSHINTLYDYCKKTKADLIMQYSFVPYRDLENFTRNWLMKGCKIKFFQLYLSFSEPVAFNFIFKLLNKNNQENNKTSNAIRKVFFRFTQLLQERKRFFLTKSKIPISKDSFCYSMPNFDYKVIKQGENQYFFKLLESKNEIEDFIKFYYFKSNFILELKGWARFEDEYYLVIEYCEETLDFFLFRKKKLTIQETINLIYEILKGYIFLNKSSLHYHSKNIFIRNNQPVFSLDLVDDQREFRKAKSSTSSYNQVENSISNICKENLGIEKKFIEEIITTISSFCLEFQKDFYLRILKQETKDCLNEICNSLRNNY